MISQVKIVDIRAYIIDQAVVVEIITIKRLATGFLTQKFQLQCPLTQSSKIPEPVLELM